MCFAKVVRFHLPFEAGTLQLILQVEKLSPERGRTSHEAHGWWGRQASERPTTMGGFSVGTQLESNTEAVNRTGTTLL